MSNGLKKVCKKTILAAMESEVFEALTESQPETKPTSQKGVARYDWTGAFVEYCNGTSIPDCALIFEIPVDALRNYATSQRWELRRQEKAIIKNAPNALKSSEEIERKARLSREIREEIIAAYRPLLRDAGKVALAIQDGTATKEKQWHNKGAVVRADCPLELADKQIAAQYIATIANGIYSALGESSGAAGAAKLGGHSGDSGSMAAPSVTIVLPGVIGAPRQEREAITIDLNSPAKIAEASAGSR